jgi:hypothetical protein
VIYLNTLLDFITSLWYIYLLAIAAAVLSVFMPKIKGYLGEKSVALFLSGLDETKYKVINNIMLQAGDKTSQIDHVIVSNYGIFVIETKNYKGWIIGNEYDDYWKQVIYKRREKLRNPIKQNFGHIQALREHLSEFLDINYISIVAFTTNCDLKVTSKTEVIYTVKLKRTIEKYTNVTISDLEVEHIYNKLFSLNVDSKDNRKAHIRSIHNNLDEIETKINNDLCPRCGNALVVRRGKYGKFKGCSNYPACRFTVK